MPPERQERVAIPDKVIVIEIPPWHAQSMMLPEPVAGESHGILVNRVNKMKIRGI